MSSVACFDVIDNLIFLINRVVIILCFVFLNFICGHKVIHIPNQAVFLGIDTFLISVGNPNQVIPQAAQDAAKLQIDIFPQKGFCMA